ncbi:MAG: SURF1 family protein [Gemmatimonadales bacterium]
MRWRGRDVTAAIVALAIAATCVRLGIWQLDRLAQRRARNAQVAARLALPPLELRGRGVSADSAGQRRIVARGVYDFARERVRPGRSFDGTPGVALVTPLRLGDGSAVLVDRGWVPSPDAYHVDQARYREPDTAVVMGVAVIVPSDGNRRDVNPGRLEDSLPYPLLPFVVRQGGSAPGAGLPRRWPPPALNDGPHLSYAIQWFSFAVIIVVGTVALLRRPGVRRAATISGRF